MKNAFLTAVLVLLLHTLATGDATATGAAMQQSPATPASNPDYAAGRSTCPIVPTPRTYRPAGPAVRAANDAAVIVLGTRSSNPERYAADRLAARLKPGAGPRLTVVAEDAIPASTRLVFVLGQRKTNRMVDRLWQASGIVLTQPDGFAIEVVDDAGRALVLVAGSNDRGVVYGADAAADLAGWEGNALTVTRASVRDWPSIAWRGRSWFRPDAYLTDDDLDAYVDARLNFVDYRDGNRRWAHANEPGGPFGITADFAIDPKAAADRIAQARRRGLFVYGTVSCGVVENRFDEVVKQATVLLDAGADGLWASFDDSGGVNRNPNKLMRRLAELCAKRGLGGPALATTPVVGSYEQAKTPVEPGHAAGGAGIGRRDLVLHLPAQRRRVRYAQGVRPQESTRLVAQLAACPPRLPSRPLLRPDDLRRRAAIH